MTQLLTVIHRPHFGHLVLQEYAELLVMQIAVSLCYQSDVKLENVN